MGPDLGRSNSVLYAGHDENLPCPSGDQHELEAAPAFFTSLSTQEREVIGYGSTLYPYANHDAVNGSLLLDQRNSARLLAAQPDALNGIYSSLSMEEVGVIGSEPYPSPCASFGDVSGLEMSRAYQVDAFGQLSTATWMGGTDIEATNDAKYRYDASSWSSATFETTPNTMHNQPSVRADRQRCVTPHKKLFSCTYDSCQRTFTTRYRLNTHVNRFHTPAERQASHQCENCSYTTFYRTDLSRHQKKYDAFHAP